MRVERLFPHLDIAFVETAQLSQHCQGKKHTHKSLSSQPLTGRQTVQEAGLPRGALRGHVGRLQPVRAPDRLPPCEGLLGSGQPQRRCLMSVHPAFLISDT